MYSFGTCLSRNWVYLINSDRKVLNLPMNSLLFLLFPLSKSCCLTVHAEGCQLILKPHVSKITFSYPIRS